MNAKVEALGRRTFASLRFRNYRLYFVSQIVSFSGTWMQSIALSWLVLELTGSGTALGTVLAMQFLPTLLLAPVGGVLADRFEKRKLILGTQTAAGLLALALGVVTLTGVVELWMVYVLAAMFGTVTALDNPSRQTFVMEMVGPADVSNAVTLNSVVVNAARVIGPAVAGVVIAMFGKDIEVVGRILAVKAFAAARPRQRQPWLAAPERSAGHRHRRIAEGNGIVQQARIEADMDPRGARRIAIFHEGKLGQVFALQRGMIIVAIVVKVAPVAGGFSGGIKLVQSRSRPILHRLHRRTAVFVRREAEIGSQRLAIAIPDRIRCTDGRRLFRYCRRRCGRGW